MEAVSTRSFFLHSLRHPGLGLPASRTGRIDVCCLSPQPAVCVRAPEQRNTALRSMQALFPDPVILGMHRPLPTSCCPGGPGSAGDPGPASPCSRPLHLPQGPPPDAHRTGTGPFVPLPQELARQMVRSSDLLTRHTPIFAQTLIFPTTPFHRNQTCSRGPIRVLPCSMQGR